MSSVWNCLIVAVTFVVINCQMLTGSVSWDPWLGRLYHDNDDNGIGVCGVFLVSRPPNTQNYRTDSSDIVLTSARCIMNYSDTSGLKVLFPRANDDPLALKRHFIRVARVLVPEHYKHEINAKIKIMMTLHNIAMLRLEKRVDFSSTIQPIQLANKFSDSSCSFTALEAHGSLAALTKPDALRLVPMPMVTRKQRGNSANAMHYIEATLDGTKRFRKADFGSPLTCMQNDRRVVQGISSTGNGEVESFTDIVQSLQWITKAYKLIDEENFYHEDLNQYINGSIRTSGMILKYLHYLLNGVLCSVPSNLDNRSGKQRLETSTVQRWYNEYYYRRIKVKANHFGVGEIFDYLDDQDVYTCAMMCMLTNENGSCNYLPSMRRCYFIEKPAALDYSVKTPAEQSLIIYNDKTKFGEYKPQRPTVKNEQKLSTWKVSLTVSHWSSFHCLGSLSSKDGQVYSSVSFSSACIQELLLNKPKAAKSKMLVNLDSNVVDIKAMNANISPDGIFSSDIKPIKKPNDYPDVYGDLQSEPVLKIFNPSSGTFMSQPCSMPWMVHFQLGKDKICAGILISKNDIIDQHHNQPIDESIQYILTTASCAKDVRTTWDGPKLTTIMTGSYFSNQASPFGFFSYVSKVLIHPNSNEIVKSTEKLTPEHVKINNIAVLEINDRRKKFKNIQPIHLPTVQWMGNIDEAETKIVTRNVKGGDAFGPLYDVPVERIAKLSSDGLIATKRLFYKGTKIMSQEIEGRPLIAHSAKEGAILLGLYSTTVVDGQQPIEKYEKIEQHLSWLKDAIQNPAKYVYSPDYDDY